MDRVITTLKRLYLSQKLKSRQGYNQYLKVKYNIRPTLQIPVPEERYNSVLQSYRDLKVVKDKLTELDLHLAEDDPKNWDSFIALSYILNNSGKKSRIFDAGAEKYSRLLPWLSLYGYRHLCGGNIVFDKTGRMGSIRYMPLDITNTPFKDSSFDIITCLSVIEHGVNIQNYFAEMYRILKPGGALITSTDYFEPKIKTSGIYAYNSDVHIFDQTEMEQLLNEARITGFQLTGNLDYSCNEKVVTWKRFNLGFTFIVFTLIKN